MDGHTEHHFAENIRLVIWDLDDTYWDGTLTEGGISYRQDHHDIVVELAKRGIMSSVCSKNDHESIMAVLRERGIAEYFIFPSIDWTPKAERINSQIEEIGLRPETVLFIDDNHQNLQQAKDRTPKLNVAYPAVIGQLLAHDQFKGKDDNELSRLKQYKNLEAKAVEKTKSGGDNTAFLRSSDVRVYFEYDLESNIDRVIELVNRTNQLNFTKNRLPEDPEEARAAILPVLRHSGTMAGLVRVVDKYGDYGFVGFFAMGEIGGTFYLKHFCFSCRTINMYVEHFVYNFLNRPVLHIQGEVLSDVHTPIDVDWIKALPIDELASPSSEGVQEIPSIFARGGCDLMALMHYFSLNTSNMSCEFNAIKNHQSVRSDHSCFLMAALSDMTPEKMAAAESIGYDASDFKTDFLTSGASLVMLSFWADADIPYYRHRATGLELPSFLIGGAKEDLITDEATVERLAGNDVQRRTIAALKADWEYCWGFSHEEMVTRYKRVLSMVPSSSTIVMTLANDRHPQHFSDIPGVWVDENHVNYNKAVLEAVEGFDNIVLVDFGAYIQKLDDMLDINHLRRDLYFKVYQEVLSKISDRISLAIAA